MPLDESTDIGCLINENAAIRVSDQVKETVSQGANIVVGGRRKGAFFEPTIIDNVTKDMDVMKDMEIFGPVILFVLLKILMKQLNSKSVKLWFMWLYFYKRYEKCL